MFGQEPRAARDPNSDRPEKESRSRFGEWVQTTQGLVSIIATIVALIGGGSGAVFAIYGGSPHPSPSPTPTPSITVTTPNPSPTNYFDQPSNSAQLTQALLPPGALGTTATVSNYGTDLSSLTLICGGLIPKDAQLNAHETLYDAQTEQSLQESIIEWDSSGDAATLITDDHTALDQTSNCSFNTASGETIQWTGDDPGSAPQECGNSQYVATQVLTQSPDWSGLQTVVQCDRYTITTTILDDNDSTATQEAADDYLANAIARLQGAIA